MQNKKKIIIFKLNIQFFFFPISDIPIVVTDILCEIENREPISKLTDMSVEIPIFSFFLTLFVIF